MKDLNTISVQHEACERDLGFVVGKFVEVSFLQLQVYHVSFVQRQEGRVRGLLATGAAVSSDLVPSVPHQRQPGMINAMNLAQSNTASTTL